MVVFEICCLAGMGYSTDPAVRVIDPQRQYGSMDLAIELDGISSH